jgi:hypothetical protein
MFRTALISGMAFLCVGAVSPAWSAETGEDKPNDSRIWTGVFTAAQAERGKADFDKVCSNCHNTNLTGTARAPSLLGDRFLQAWQSGSLNVLYEKLRDSMPANYPESVPEETKIDILTYLLQQNAFPAGSAELKLDVKQLSDIQIVPKDSRAVANFALVRMVGCLAEGPGNRWTLSKSTEPAITKDETANPAALKAASESALGSQSFELISVNGFKPESLKSQRVEARGLLYRDSGHSEVNLTSLAGAGSGCN